MQILLVFIMASALVISFELTPVAFAQQTPSSVENAKKEGEVVWYGTLTGGSIVGRILKSFEARAFSRRGFLELSQRRQAALSVDRIKYPAPPDTKVSERIQTWITEHQQTFRIPVGRK